MASILQATLGQLKALAAQSRDAVAAPEAPPPEPLTLDKPSSATKKLPGGSIVKMNDGSFRALSVAKPFTGGASPRLHGTESGSLAATAAAIEIGNVNSIIMGILTDDNDMSISGANSDKLTVYGIPVRLVPEVASLGGAFERVLFRSTGQPDLSKTIEEAVTLLGLQWQQVGSARVARIMNPRAPLVSVADAAATTLTEIEAVGNATAFSVARAANLAALGLLAAPASGGPSTRVAPVGELVAFVCGACGSPEAADTAAICVHAALHAYGGSDVGEKEVHRRARGLGLQIINDMRSVVDSLDSASIRWLADQRARLTTAGFTVGGAQLGALAPQAAAAVAKEHADAAAAAAAKAAPAMGGSTPSVAAITQQVVAELRTAFGLPGGASPSGQLILNTPSGPLGSPPPFPALGTPPGGGMAATTPGAHSVPRAPPPTFFSPPPLPPAAHSAPPTSAFPAINCISPSAVSDESEAAAALHELGGGDPQKLCDMLAKMHGVSFNLASELSFSIEEQAADADSRLLAAMRRTAEAHPSDAGLRLEALPRPQNWAESRRRLGSLLQAFHRLNEARPPTTSGGAGPSASGDVPAATEKLPEEWYYSPKEAAEAERPEGIHSLVAAAMLGDAAVRADAAAVEGADHAAECTRLRDSFGQSAQAYLTSSGKVFGSITGKRREGKLPAKLERARECTIQRIQQLLERAITPKRLDSEGAAQPSEAKVSIAKVAACAKRVACLNFQVGELTRYFGGDAPSAGRSATVARWGLHTGGSIVADGLAKADIKAMSVQVDELFQIIFCDVLGQDVPNDAFSAFVSSASSQLDIARLVEAIEALFDHLRHLGRELRGTVGATPPSAAAAIAWTDDKHVIALSQERAGEKSGAEAGAAAAAAFFAKYGSPKALGKRGLAEAPPAGSPEGGPKGGKPPRTKKTRWGPKAGEVDADDAAVAATAAEAAKKAAAAKTAAEAAAKAATGGGAGGGGEHPDVAAARAKTATRSDWSDGAIHAISSKKPNSAFFAFEQLTAGLPAAERPCFQHFCVKPATEGEASCRASSCRRAHALSDAARKVCVEAVPKIYAATKEKPQQLLRSTLA